MEKRFLRKVRKLATGIWPEAANAAMAWALLKKPMNLRNPATFNEKINWLKLNVFPRDDRVISCTDKIAVRDYVVDKGYADLLNELYGVWEHVEDIKWKVLPDSFVLKCNHGCGYNILCPDKRKLDWPAATMSLERWMHEDFWKVSCEPHYRTIPRRILCERYLGDNLLNFKFFCFSGEVRLFYISQNENGDFHNARISIYEQDGTPARFRMANHKVFEQQPELPENLDEMILAARVLSEGFPFVRVDFLAASDRFYFSELTFTPSAGMIPFLPASADLELGKYLDLAEYGK